MTNLTNINSITMRGKKMEVFENITLSTTATDAVKKKTILSRYLIEELIKKQTPESTENTFLAPSECWTIKTEDGQIQEGAIYEHIGLKLLSKDTPTTVFTDTISGEDFSRTSSSEASDLAGVIIKDTYDFNFVCIPKSIKVVNTTTEVETVYEIKYVVLKTILDYVIAPTVEFFTSNDAFTTIGESLSLPSQPATDGDEVSVTTEFFSKSFIWYGAYINFNVKCNVENIVDTISAAPPNNEVLKLELVKCKNLICVGTAFKEITLSKDLAQLKDWKIGGTKMDLFMRHNPIVTIPKDFVCTDNILETDNIKKQDFEKLIVMDIEYITTVKTPALTKPVDRYTLWNQEDRQMELFYRHRMNVSNDALFKRNSELYDQTYKLKLIPDQTNTKFFYNPEVNSNLPIYFFASMIYDEDYMPYELSELTEAGDVNTVNIRGDKLFKVEVSEKFYNLKFRFFNDTTPTDFIIRYSMPNLGSDVLDSTLGTLFLNDGTTFIEAGLDDSDSDAGNWSLMPSAPLRKVYQCKTKCKTIYLGVEYFNSEILEENTTEFRYGKYTTAEDASKSCFENIYIPIECIEQNPLTPTKTEEEHVKIVKKILFGDENFASVNVEFYSDSNISTDFTTRGITEQQNVFGRKFYVIDKE